jgi:hypothetical protein
VTAVAAASVAGFLWLVAASLMGRLRQERSAARFWLCATVVELAVSASLFLPAVAAVVDRHLPMPLADPLARTAALLAAFSGQMVAQVLIAPGRGGLRRHRARLAVLAAALIAMWVCFAMAQPHVVSQAGQLRSVSAWAAAYLVAFLAYLASAVVDLLVRSHRFAGTAEPTLALGLRITAAGYVVVLGYVVLKVLGALSAATGQVPRSGLLVTAPPLLAVTAGALTVLGAAWLAVGRAVRVGVSSLQHYRACRELYPLWASVTSRVPGITLDSSGGRVRDGLRLLDPGRLVYRRVIELQDAHLALVESVSEALIEQARRDAVSAGRVGVDAAAYVEATALHAALVLESPTLSRSAWADPDRPVGGSLADEVAWWLLVSRDFRRLSAPLGATTRVGG